jgi:hypothetical protein
MVSTPAVPVHPAHPSSRSRPAPLGSPAELPAVDERSHWFHTGVHRLCTAGDGCCRASRRTRSRSDISAGRGPVRTEERTVWRSADRRGRPARRDPDVRRGATATLTAPSTARQRSGDPPGRVGSGVPPSPGCLSGGSSVVAVRPASGSSASSVMLAGVCGRFRPPSPCAQPSCAGGGRGVSFRSDQLPGSSGCGTSPSVPAAPALPPTGGCAPPMSCSRSTS